MNNIWQGKLVRLRGLRMEDAEIMAALPADTEAEAFSWHTNLPLNRTLEWERSALAGFISDTRSDSNDFCKLAIESVPGGQWVGTVGLHNTNRRNRSAELNVWVGSGSLRGKGYGGEAILIMLNYAFNELDYQRVGLSVVEPNMGAYNLYYKLGFVEEGRLRRAFFYRGQYHAEIKMSLLKEEFAARHGPFIKYLYSER